MNSQPKYQNTLHLSDTCGKDGYQATWEREIREYVLQERRAAALQAGEADASLESFVGDPVELSCEIDRLLWKHLNALQREWEALHEYYAEFPHDDHDLDEVEWGECDGDDEDCEEECDDGEHCEDDEDYEDQDFDEPE